ncbi:hypothetical protein WN55_01549 [Dufourea novaeangliae]|uniref:Uncharacterized protein n=1 Tax=Dufourea novaeangliae TaxID=178035 RepID=A0A154PI28_DUFNO|nr:hypothetical protein WN55_01549 [Dufourea novaeangliae]
MEQRGRGGNSRHYDGMFHGYIHTRMPYGGASFIEQLVCLPCPSKDSSVPI